MENGLQKPAREIGVITAEVKELCRQAQHMALAFIIEIGRRLVEAKACLPHGEWGDWLTNEVNFSQATANNYMKIFEEYGSDQISFFGATNSETFANLPYSKALKLIALPADERETFIEENDVEDMSVRDLDAAIRERNEARAAAEEAQRRAQDAEEAAEEARQAAEEAGALRQAVDKLTADLARAKEGLSKANDQAKEAKDKLAAALKDPKVSPEQLKKIRKEATEAAEDAAAKKYADTQKKLDEAAARAQAAEARQREAEERLADAERKVRTASPEITAFKTLFDEIQKTAQTMKGMIERLEQTDPETAGKLRGALTAFGKTL